MTLGLRPLGRGVVHLWIEDDGCGLGQSARPSGSRMGLDSMRKRAKDLRGELRVTSAPGRGTRIDLWFHADGQVASGPPGAASQDEGNERERQGEAEGEKELAPTPTPTRTPT